MNSYAFLVTACYIAGMCIVAFQASRDKRRPREIARVIVVMALSAWVGSKLFHAIFEARGHELSTGQIAMSAWALFIDDPWHGLRLFDPGFVFWGGLLTSTIVTYLCAPGAYGNYAVPALGLGILVGRVGCYLTGCCYGLPGHPVQLYDAAFGLFVLAYRRLTFAQFLVAYSVWRFGTEFFRADIERGLWLAGLSTSQIISLIVLIGWLIAHRKVSNPEAEGDPIPTRLSEPLFRGNKGRIPILTMAISKNESTAAHTTRLVE